MTAGLSKNRKHIHKNSLLLKYTHKTTKTYIPQHLVLSRQENFKGICISELYFVTVSVGTHLTASPVTVTQSE